MTFILAGNYGEVGALNLYGPAYGLPEAISGVNTSWYRGYGDPDAQAAIVAGIPRGDLMSLFRTCAIAGQNT